jgi:hypothetical protein
VGRVPGGAAAAANPTTESGPFERAAGILRRPRATLAEVAAARPRWADVLALSSGAAVLASTLLYATDVGRQALVDQWERTAFALGRELDDQQYARLVELSEYAEVYGAVSALVNVAVLSVAVAVLVYVVLRRWNRVPTFPRVLAVAAHASVILALRLVIAAPVGYARESTASVTSLGNWFQLFVPGSAAARFLAVLDLMIMWWAVVAALGIARVYGQSAPRVVIAFIGIYAGLALLLATVVTALAPG